MEEKELLALCQEKGNTSFPNIPTLYWTAEIYGFGKYIREYGHYPLFLPLCVYTDHGPGEIDSPFKHELESLAQVQLYHSPNSVKKWLNISTKPSYCMYSPFVYYRKSRKVERVVDSKGTIAFPAHTTESIEDISNIEEYINQLLSLPEEFKPVSVCLHMHDINKGRYKPYMERGIPVFTAGNTSDYKFTERFYNILSKFSYATSNMAGSYVYYSVEMGIPFSIYGNEQKFINKDDPNICLGKYDPYKESQSYKRIHDIFNGLFTSITIEQQELVEIGLGIRNGISRWKMSQVLYSALMKFILIKASSKFSALWGEKKNNKKSLRNINGIQK